MKKNLIFFIFIIMFFFKNTAYSNDKNFYDFQINDISGEVINFKDYKNKVYF